jgi:hypothetical protein
MRVVVTRYATNASAQKINAQNTMPAATLVMASPKDATLVSSHAPRARSRKPRRRMRHIPLTTNGARDNHLWGARPPRTSTTSRWDSNLVASTQHAAT